MNAYLEYERIAALDPSDRTETESNWFENLRLDYRFVKVVDPEFALELSTKAYNDAMNRLEDLVAGQINSGMANAPGFVAKLEDATTHIRVYLTDVQNDVLAIARKKNSDWF